MNNTGLILAISLGVSLVAEHGAAQTWPNKTLKAIVPVGAGSTTDIVPRVVFEQLASQIGQNVIVENRPGAGGTIGSAAVARAEPNGYTMLVHSNAHTIAPALHPKLPYHPSRDFAAVAPLGMSVGVLVVAPTSGFKTAAELVAAAKTRPITFSSVGVGTATHLSAERFRLSARMEALHVPFKGGAEAMSEVVAGRIDFFIGPVGIVLPLVRNGQLVALAVNSRSRAAALPEVQTTREAGFLDAEYPIWFGIFLPRETPGEIVAKLHDQTVSSLRTPKIAAKLAELGVEPMNMTPGEFADYVAQEVALNAALVKTIGLKAD